MRILRFLVLLIVVSLVAGVTCYLTGMFIRSHDPMFRFTHAGIHQQLGLTPEQERELQPSEEQFQARKASLLNKIREANRELAEAILADQADSSRVSAAVAKIHAAQGKLEEATLAHVFQMKAGLRPDQYRKLLELTAQALQETAAD
jgi:Spy/CpxP family protein refolding chaperone